MDRPWLLFSLPLLAFGLVVACGPGSKDDDDDDDDGGDDTAIGEDTGGGSGTGGGGDSGITERVPDIAAEPGSLDFGSVYSFDSTAGAPPPDEASQVVTISNVGDADLLISDIALQEGGSAYSLGAISSPHIPSGDTASFTVTLAPEVTGVAGDTVLVSSNDPDEAVLQIPITGLGVAPAIEITPSEHDFGTIFIGCSDLLELTIQNVGNAELVVSDFEFNTGTTDLVFDAGFGSHGALPWTIAPGDSRRVAVEYTPFDEYDDISYLFVSSNDPYIPEAMAIQEAGGELYGSTTDIHEQPLSTRDTFALTAVPVVETLTVRIDGVTTTVGWRHDATLNAVVFDTDHVPEGGSTIEISYAISGCAR